MNLFTLTLALPLAKIEARPPIIEDIQYQLVGFMVVMIALTTLWLSVEFLGRFFRAIERARAARPAVEPPVPAAGGAQEVDDPELVAVIAAAVDTVIPEPHQIVAISLVEDHPSFSTLSQSAWSVEGRRQIYSSHKIR